MTFHLVIREMHAIGTFINEDCDRSVGSGIGDVLDHLLHDERISDDKSYDLRCLASGFATQNVAQVEFREKHKTCTPETALHDALQIPEVFCRPRRPEE